MWESWQQKVQEALPFFARCPIYVEQNSLSREQFETVARYVKDQGPIDMDGRARDAEFGGRVVNTPLGPVTRMWLDSNVEFAFLRRHLGPTLGVPRVLDIGAGYGRFAVTIAPHVKSVTCVDAVPISTACCRDYCGRFNKAIQVPTIQEFAAKEGQSFDLAVNIHSWNECTLEQVTNWLNVLGEMKVPFLFTVSHGTLHGPEKAYYSWNHGQPSYRPAIEARYDLVAEEELGLSGHPHALWRLR
jgi:SAM-dependent methyltransferase